MPEGGRKASSIGYVYNAPPFYHQTLLCVMRLPERRTFLVAQRTVDEAALVLKHAKSANSIYVSRAVDAQLRRMHLQEAYGCAQTLSSYVDETWALFPPTATTERKPYISEAMYRDWVGLVDKELSLLKGVVKADGKHYSKYLKEDTAFRPIDAGVQMRFFDPA